jgi:hypothetical protein
MDQRKGKSPRAASLNSPKIIIDDWQLKKDLLEIGSKKGENMKETVKRLVNKELGKGV